nr:MAG TPA: hypothetical protein [Caudoviricetes sp.]
MKSVIPLLYSNILSRQFSSFIFFARKKDYGFSP